MTPMDFFNVTAGIASIVGLVLTYLVKRDVREIEKGYQRKLRIGDLQKAIGDHRSNLSTLLGDPGQNVGAIRERLSSLKGTLGSLLQVVGPEVSREVMSLRTDIDDYLGDSDLLRRFSQWVRHLGASVPDARKIRDRLAMIEEQLKNVQKDDKSRAR